MAKSHRRCVGVNLKKLGTSNWWLLSPNNYSGSNANEWNVNGLTGTSTTTTSTTLTLFALDSYYVEYLIIFAILSIKNI